MAVTDLIRLLHVNPVYCTRLVHMKTTEPEPARVRVAGNTSVPFTGGIS